MADRVISSHKIVMEYMMLMGILRRDLWRYCALQTGWNDLPKERENAGHACCGLAIRRIFRALPEIRALACRDGVKLAYLLKTQSMSGGGDGEGREATRSGQPPALAIVVR
jgi:hypothetical protein